VVVPVEQQAARAEDVVRVPVFGEVPLPLEFAGAERGQAAIDAGGAFRQAAEEKKAVARRDA
jgi:hypothetical protein